MEALYSKLYDKYNQLKTSAESELEQCNREQELKFVNYVAAAEKMIDHLKNENDRRRAEINELKDQITSDRSDKEGKCAEYQKSLIEEQQKTKVLYEEVTRLRNLQTEGFHSGTRSNNSKDVQLQSPSGGSQVRTKDTSSAGTEARKPCTQHCAVQTEDAEVRMVELESGAMSRDHTSENVQEPDCSTMNMPTSGDGGVSDTGHANRLLQTLLECLVGMKVSAVDQTEGLCLSFLHQSSGYSFSLTWVRKSPFQMDDAELLYHVFSLGTLERMAPEWMKEDLIFTMSMSRVFFERLSQVIKSGVSNSSLAASEIQRCAIF